MNLRQRLTLSIIAVLILFSINALTAYWSQEVRKESIDALRTAVSGQFQADTTRQNLDDLRKAVLLLSSLRSTLNENLSKQEVAQAHSEINNLELQIKNLREAVGSKHSNDYLRLVDNFKRLKPLWWRFYERYNDPQYDHYREGDFREQYYISTIQELSILEKILISNAEQQTVAIDQIEQVTNRISAAVYLVSFILTVGLGYFLLRYTNESLQRLKKGANQIGGGQLDYRIPVTSKDELGEVAKAFNSMAAKLQNAIAEVRRAKEHADQANRAKSSFLANMSHELRTPLNAIIGYSEMMIEDLELGDFDQQAHHKDLDKVLTAGRHLLTQINDVLDFSKIETGKMMVYNEEFDSKAVLQEVLATISPLAKKGNNELEFVCPDQLPSMINDVTKFRQIFFNLLSNACKFTENGRITLTANYDDSAQPPLLRFEVSDNGIGMNLSQLESVFEAFVQADSSTTRRYGGTGLGLSLCKQYCQLMGGRISVESKENIGTCFTTDFPVNRADDIHATIVDDQPASAKRKRDISILVIDDDPIALSLTERFLNRHDYKLETCNNGKEGLVLAEQTQPDIILLDLMMPVIDGWTVLSVLKKNPNTQHIPVILMSMLDEAELGKDMGATDYLRKPIDWEKLENLVEQLGHPNDRGQLILLDDQSSQRDRLRNALQKDGWHVQVYDSVPAVIPAIDQQQPSALIVAAAVFCNYEKYNFYQWLNEVSSKTSSLIPIIVIENNLDRQDIDATDSDHIYWLQREGFDVDEIINTLNQQVSGQAYRNEALRQQ
jgi:signal transduction histidine kinase/DNA-binding response OmpR family regulator